MYNAFLQRTAEAIYALGKHIRTSDRFRTAALDDKLRCGAAAPCFDPALGNRDTMADSLQWRIIDHCAAVTRIYAIYEQFSHEMVREHLGLLQSRLPFSDLPEAIQSSYRLGLSRILEKKDGPRYADLNLSHLVDNYGLALQGKIYSLEPRAMLMQEQNLRLPELHRFMSASGVDGVSAWIEGHRSIKGFFAASDRLGASAEKELAELIKYRNDASHGSIDIGDILHVNVLIEFCDFILAVCEALAERVQLVGLQTLKLHGHVTERGVITESLKADTVGIGNMVGDFSRGLTVYLCGEGYCLERTVVNLQLNDVDHETVQFGAETEVGFLFDAPGKKNSVVMVVENVANTKAGTEAQQLESAQV
jgi:MAE_28990/MAE_18760-like HEPN